MFVDLRKFKGFVKVNRDLFKKYKHLENIFKIGKIN